MGNLVRRLMEAAAIQRVGGASQNRNEDGIESSLKRWTVRRWSRPRPYEGPDPTGGSGSTSVLADMVIRRRVSNFGPYTQYAWLLIRGFHALSV